MDDCVAELASRPESPNLYWALGELPRRQNILRHSLDVESQWSLRPDPEPGRCAKRRAAFRWPMAHAFANKSTARGYHAEGGHAQLPDAVKDASQETLKKAKTEYAAAHHLTAKQADEAESICVLGDIISGNTRLVTTSGRRTAVWRTRL